MKTYNFLLTVVLLTSALACFGRSVEEIRTEHASISQQLKWKSLQLEFAKKRIADTRAEIQQLNDSLIFENQQPSQQKKIDQINWSNESIASKDKLLAVLELSYQKRTAHIAYLKNRLLELVKEKEKQETEQETIKRKKDMIAHEKKLKKLLGTRAGFASSKLRPLRYADLLQLRCRGINDNNYENWPIAFTHPGGTAGERTQNYDSPYEILVKKDAPRSTHSGQYITLSKYGDPTYNGAVLVGDVIEILSMVATKKLEASHEHLGTGRKWWAIAQSSASYGYPRISVGPNSDPKRLNKLSTLPRPMQGNSLFTLEASGKQVGEAVLARDTVTIKTAPKNPVYPGSHLWTYYRHQSLGDWGQILIAGPGGKDSEGLATLSQDRSLSARNQFVFKPADRYSQYYTARALTTPFLPQGTIITLQPVGSSMYYVAEGTQLSLADTKPTDPAAQFEVLYDNDGWVGLRNKETQKFLQGTSPPKVNTELFKERGHTFWHWEISGHLNEAYLRNQATHLFIGAQNGQAVAHPTIGESHGSALPASVKKLKINIVSRPIARDAKPIRVEYARVGGHVITQELQKHITERGGYDAFIQADEIVKRWGNKLKNPELIQIRLGKGVPIAVTYYTGKMRHNEFFRSVSGINLLSQSPEKYSELATQPRASTFPSRLRRRAMRKFSKSTQPPQTIPKKLIQEDYEASLQGLLEEALKEKDALLMDTADDDNNISKAIN